MKPSLSTRSCPPATKPLTNLLEFVSTVVVPGTTGQFVARDTFMVNTEPTAPVKITQVDDDFREWFLSGEGLTEGSIAETTLRYHKLRKSSADGSIINELGGEAKAETTLAEMFSLMAGQKDGEAGALLTNSCVNIFYIRDRNGVLRTVVVGWDCDGWDVAAESIEDPDGWDDGRHVFSRLPAQASNPVPDPSAAA